MHAVDLVGCLASALVFATFYMKAMVPLRLVAIASNVAFIAYGYLGGMAPILLLHVGLLPLNMWRLGQTLRLMRRLPRARGDVGLSVKFLRSRRVSRRRTARHAEAGAAASHASSNEVPGPRKGVERPGCARSVEDAVVLDDDDHRAPSWNAAKRTEGGEDKRL